MRNVSYTACARDWNYGANIYAQSEWERENLDQHINEEKIDLQIEVYGPEQIENDDWLKKFEE